MILGLLPLDRASTDHSTSCPYKHLVAAFGEKVWYKKVRNKKERTNKLETEEREAIWLGHARCSNEMLIGTRSGVVRAYTVKRKEPEDRWDAQFIKEIQGTPQAPVPGQQSMEVPTRVNFDPAGPLEEGELVRPQECKDIGSGLSGL